MKSNYSTRKNNISKLRSDFDQFRKPDYGKPYIKKKLQQLENQDDYLTPWYKFSKEDRHVYPNQGLLRTPYDYLDYQQLQMLPQETIIKTLRLRHYFLEMFNHPYRIKFLEQVNKTDFVPVPKVEDRVFESAISTGLSLSIGDIGSVVVGSQNQRISRSERYAQGPFVKLGRQARSYFVGSASPDVWNSATAIATMAASHCLAGIPRNGVLAGIKRQTDLAIETFKLLNNLENQLLKGRSDRKRISDYWRRNIMGVLGASAEKDLIRAESLYNAGVKVFRIYSPEPGTGPVETVKALRKRLPKDIEIFTGMLVDVEQAKKAQAAGADGIYVGIGGGGRCITGMRSGSAVDWPELVWKLRGEIQIPIIVEGGASDHVAITLLLGASGIGVSRIVSGGTIESPGGALFCSDNNGKLFKPYGGEASARTKYLENKLLPFDIPAFVEGETTKAKMSYIKHALPTLTYNLHTLNEDAILALVFRGAKDIHELHAIDPSPLRRITTSGDFQRMTH